MWVEQKQIPIAYRMYQFLCLRRLLATEGILLSDCPCVIILKVNEHGIQWRSHVVDWDVHCLPNPTFARCHSGDWCKADNLLGKDVTSNLIINRSSVTVSWVPWLCVCLSIAVVCRSVKLVDCWFSMLRLLCAVGNVYLSSCYSAILTCQYVSFVFLTCLKFSYCGTRVMNFLKKVLSGPKCATYTEKNWKFKKKI